MKVAVLDINGVQADRDGKLTNYFLVEDNYDFGGNSATDVTDISNLVLMFDVGRFDNSGGIIGLRDSVKAHFEGSMSSDFDGASAEDKLDLCKLFIATAAQRGATFTGDQEEKAALSFAEQKYQAETSDFSKALADELVGNDADEDKIKETSNASDTVCYKPVPRVISQSTTTIDTDSTTSVEVLGEFLDYVRGVKISSLGSGVGSVVISSQSYSRLVLDVTVDATADTYSILMALPNGTLLLADIEAKAITVVIPSLDGSGSSLWTKSGSSNAAALGDGTYEASNNSGNGWNEHATYGPHTGTTGLSFFMTVGRLQGASNAYCYITLSGNNSPSSVLYPAIYVQAGGTLIVYDENDAATTVGTVAVDDIIEVRITTTTFKVFKNGSEIFTHTGTYSITGIYHNFTGYRVFSANNIRTEIY